MNEFELPLSLKHAIDCRLSKVDLKSIQNAAGMLSQKYRTKNHNIILESPLEYLAYLITRMPATYGVLKKVFTFVKYSYQGPPLKSFLDIGSGPGTSFWAAVNIWDSFRRFTALDRDPEWTSMAKVLAEKAKAPFLNSVYWKTGNVDEFLEIPKNDFVVLSYSLGEMKNYSKTAISSWQSARHLLVIIEPGTPLGFERISQIRCQLLDLGAHILLPCPNIQECPMPSDDWCHFSQRISRKNPHRKFKKGTLPYEDEKFSYVVFSKNSHPQAQGRIVRTPLKGKGHVIFDLCTSKGLNRQIISKKQYTLYRLARKAAWGQSWEF